MRSTLQSILFLFIFLALPAFGQPQLFRMDDSHSFAGFNVKYLKLVNAEGRFTFMRGAFLIDTSDITKTSFSVLIKSESINTANEGRDEDLRSESFFETDKYPVISFQSKKVEKDGNGYVATGSFVMHGVTKEIKLPFTFLGNTVDQRGNVRVGFESKSTIYRSEFGVKGSSMAVNDDVAINLTVLAIKQNLDSMRMTGFGGKKNISAVLNETIASKGIKEAVEQYKSLRAAQDTSYDFGANQLGMLTRKLADKGKTKEAIEIAKLNLEAYPNDTQQYFMLGYAYQKDGQKDTAHDQYKKALELDAFNASAVEMLRWVE